MSSSNPAPFLLHPDERYDSTNWIDWKATIWAAAKSRGLEGYLDGTNRRPSPAPDSSLPMLPTLYWGSENPSAEEWRQRDAFTQGMVVLNVKNAIGHGVTTDGTAAETWSSLTSIKDAVSDLGLLKADEDLRSIKYEDGKDLDAHFASLRKAWAHANGQGGTMTDAQFRMVVLGSMPPSWNLIVGGLHQSKDSATVITGLTMYNLISHAQQTGHDASDTRTGDSIARTTSQIDGRMYQHASMWARRTSSPGLFQARRRKGWSVPGLVGKERKCHTSSGNNDCGPYYDDYRSSELSDSPHDCAIERRPQHHIILLILGYVVVFPAALEGSTASAGGTFVILGRGDVRKVVEFKGRRIELTFRDTIHTPNLSHNLISIGRLGAAGFTTAFGKHGATFIDPSGNEFLFGPTVGTMYKVETSEQKAVVLYSRSKTKPTDFATWHRRLTHVGVDSIEAMIRGGLVRGLELTGKGRPVGKCKDCIFGKHTRHPFNGEAAVEKELNERAYTDLWGPARVQSTAVSCT
ncbi:hypothetical protein D9615_000329 [Tricholomella constricta]|uniref:GAG-pre-integrase domain-containing protein n=1 Tax=Tricholomella constricta TaxID=117010 RepID=A0A8H5MBG7_9AGAR|nr:hypothetical protein D9615_000329 [Tricholomella constricta]